MKLGYLMENLAPRVETVEVSRVESRQGGGGSAAGGASEGQSKTLKIKWKASDENEDKLEYKVFVREVDRQGWVRIAKDQEGQDYAWDSLTAADGRYEVKVEASDGPSNPVGIALSDSRISRPIVVDNTPPEVAELSYQQEGNKLAVGTRVNDALSVIASVQYSVDSAEKWRLVLPKDGIYDSREEQVAFEVEIEETGEHLVAIRYTDGLGNVTYRNLVVELSGQEGVR